MRLSLFILALSLSASTLPAQEESQDSSDSFAEASQDLDARDDLEARRGLLTLHVDSDEAALLLELPAPDESGICGEYIYVESLRSGLGSNPVGLDRGQLGESRFVRFRRIGKKVLLEEPNLQFRARTPRAEEKNAVKESFATSVLWGQEAKAVSDDGKCLVDLSSFLLRDSHSVSRTLEAADQGSYSLDSKRSAILVDECRVFPRNIELEALLTFKGSAKGSHVRETTPSPDAITLTTHHSFIALPSKGYRPRPFHPRSGFFGLSFDDYSAALDSSTRVRWIMRHRLEKTDADAPKSPVKEPIVYYLDRGVPEPVRSALLQGASWWGKAFEAAGFIDAFRVEVLPKDAHPLDVRYNVIQWVHRSTRGWSYGSSIYDPRTGEILKGHVSLGSLRVRQDRLLFEGLAGTAKTGSGDADDPIELALARIRQLSAHEVGHTLGLAHNFAASTYGGRASVMDYPAPLVTLRADDTLDFSKAYGVGIGIWDRQAIKYGYSQFDRRTEAAGLAAILREAEEPRWLFLSDADARGSHTAHPAANLWDNGSDPVEALRQALRVRDVALTHFDETRVRIGDPIARLREVFVPVFLYHRYQVQAAAKVIGGVNYRYARRGDADAEALPVDEQQQAQALLALFECLATERLEISTAIVSKLAPKGIAHLRNRELPEGFTGSVFDPTAMAVSAADLVFVELTNPARCARVQEQQSRHKHSVTLADIFAGVRETIASTQYLRFVLKLPPLPLALLDAWIGRLMNLSRDRRAAPGVRIAAEVALENIASALRKNDKDPMQQTLAARVQRHLERSDSAESAPTPRAPPPGSPIGTGFIGGGHRQACSLDH